MNYTQKKGEKKNLFFPFLKLLMEFFLSFFGTFVLYYRIQRTILNLKDLVEVVDEKFRFVKNASFLSLGMHGLNTIMKGYSIELCKGILPRNSAYLTPVNYSSG